MPRIKSTTADLTHYCRSCISCVKPTAEQCSECGSERPSGGWFPLDESPYRFLGKTIDERYFLDRFLDSGASGHVYRARGIRFTRHFAIKIVDTNRAGDEEFREQMVRSFQREIDTLSQIKNPHVVGVYEAIKLSETIFGLVMEYIDGQTLDQLMEDRQGLPIEDAVSIVQQIANGLHEAHRSGIIHRDIKPQNIMVEKLPATGLFARVLDFGIAHVVGSNQQSHRFLGTPLYASPEQCRGNLQLDGRTDIYSLGCLLFHLLTGQPPFPFTNALRVMDAHLESSRPRLQDAAPSVEYPPELENLVAHLLTRDRGQRPFDLHLVHQDLTAFLKGKPLVNFGSPPDYRLQEDDSLAMWSETFEKSEPSGFHDFVSLAERTSNELASDPTFSEIGEVPGWDADSEVDMVQLSSFPSPFSSLTPTITASVIDRRGLACVLVDHSPCVYFMELGEGGFRSTFQQSRLVSAAEVDLMQGMLLIADVSGELRGLDLGGEGSRITTFEGSPVALELVPTTSQLYVGTERGHLHVFDMRTNSQRELVRFPHAISNVYARPGRPILVGLWDGSVAQLDREGKISWHIPMAPDTVASTGYLDEESYFALDSQGDLHVGSVENGERDRSYSIGRGLRTVRHLDDGRLLGLSVFGNQIQIWEIFLDH